MSLSRKGKSEKKKIIAVVFVIILILGYVLIRPVWIPEGENVPVVLAENFLGKQMSLSDYRVWSAEFNPTESQPGKYIQVYYDVKPKDSAYFSWNAGNGTEGEDGWLVNKFAFMEYVNIGNLYITLGSFTGF